MPDALHVYVAGSSREIPRVREAIRALVRTGCTISGDWVSQVEQHGSAGAKLDETQRSTCAAHDLDAIDRADAFLLLWPRTESVGAYLELGYALALREHAVDSKSRVIVIAGGPDGGTIWHAYLNGHAGCDVRPLDDEAVNAVVSMLRGSD